MDTPPTVLMGNGQDFSSPTSTQSVFDPVIPQSEFQTTSVCGFPFTLPKRYTVIGPIGKGGYGSVM
jgi:hypothetical protein